MMTTALRLTLSKVIESADYADRLGPVHPICQGCRRPASSFRKPHGIDPWASGSCSKEIAKKKNLGCPLQSCSTRPSARPSIAYDGQTTSYIEENYSAPYAHGPPTDSAN